MTRLPDTTLFDINRPTLDAIMAGTSCSTDRAVAATVFNGARQDCGLTWEEAAAVLGISREDVWIFDRLDMDAETAQRAVIAAERLSNTSAHDKMRLAAYRAQK